MARPDHNAGPRGRTHTLAATGPGGRDLLSGCKVRGRPESLLPITSDSRPTRGSPICSSNQSGRVPCGQEAASLPRQAAATRTLLGPRSARRQTQSQSKLQTGSLGESSSRHPCGSAHTARACSRMVMSMCARQETRAPGEGKGKFSLFIMCLGPFHCWS